MLSFWNISLAINKEKENSAGWGRGQRKALYISPTQKCSLSFPAVLRSDSGCIQVCHRPSGNTHAENQKSPILELWQVLPFPSGSLEGGLWRNVWLMPSLWEEENMIVHSFLVPSIIFSGAHGEAYSFTCNICRTNFQRKGVVLNKANIVL